MNRDDIRAALSRQTSQLRQLRVWTEAAETRLKATEMKQQRELSDIRTILSRQVNQLLKFQAQIEKIEAQQNKFLDDLNTKYRQSLTGLRFLCREIANLGKRSSSS